MAPNPYDHIFEQHIYVKREIDSKLGMILDSFGRGRRPMRWVSLRAPQGSGRTLLLERLRRLQIPETAGDILRIFVPGGFSRVADLNPLAAELYSVQVSAERTVSGWLRSKIRETRRRVSNSTWRQIFITLLLSVAYVVLTSLLVGLGEFVTLPETELITLEGWLSFFFTYLPRNWAKFPVWFLIGSLVGLPLYLLTVYRNRNRLLPAPSDVEPPTKNQIAEFNSHVGLQKSLFDLLTMRKQILLLVDDAHRLSKIEQDFLHNLFVPDQRDSFSKKGWKILVVTVDGLEIDRQQALHKEMHASFEALEVSHFELVELQAIADSQLPADEMQSPEEMLNLLEQAQTDVNALFASQNRKLIEEVGEKFEENDIDGEFTPAKLLAYRITRRDHSISKTALTKWLNGFSTQDQLEIFQLTKSETDQRLVLELAKSGMVDRKGDTIVFDPERSEAVRQWLKQNNLSLLQQAHFYWFRTALGQVNANTEIGRLPSEERQKLRLGAWHSLQLNILKAVPALIEQAPGLTSNERGQLGDEASRLLMPAIALARCEGDFERADVLASNAVEWLYILDAPTRIAGLNRLADQMWRNYLLSGDPVTRQKLDQLANNFSELAKEPTWIIYRHYDDWRQGISHFEELPAETEPAEADHQNLSHLTRLLCNIKQRYGFLSSALEDKDFPIPEAINGGSNIFAEFELRALHAAALNERGENERLVHVLEAWRTRLLDTAPPDDLLGNKALHLYYMARYWHILSDSWQLGLRRANNLPEEERKLAEEKLAAQIQSLFLPSQIAPAVAELSPFQQAENAYDQTRRLLVLLGWRALLIEASFHLGVLLAVFQPENLEPEKWEWDKLFTQVLQLEAELGWLIHAPTIHRIRWEHVYVLDRELSIEDAYNVYQTLIKGGYPNALIVEWHQQTARLLNNYGQNEEDRRRSAELYEQWARTLAGSAAARRFWTHTKLNYEQASALMFAAQAWRGQGEFDTAEQFLNEAESFLDSSSGSIEEGELRQLQIQIRLQRAWLLGQQERGSQYHQMMRTIWRSLRFEDPMVANIMGSLLAIESAQGVLNTPWPPNGKQLANVDPDNGTLSLPPDWFDGQLPLVIPDLFQFRFRQLVRLVSDERQPTYEQLLWAASNHWWRREKFGEIAIQFGQTALGHTLSPDVETLILNLLQAVRTYFSKVEGVDRRELETLRLLMNYKAGAKKYRAEYIKVLIEFETLVEREKRVRQISETLNWPSVAFWAYTHLWLLVDEVLIKQYLVANQMIDQFMNRREHLVKTFQAATQRYDDSDISGCLEELEKIPPPNGQFVLIEDILAIDLWLKCKQQLSETRTEEFNKRTTQLREAVIQYVKQLSSLISERQVQLLALNILTDLKQAAGRIQVAEASQNVKT